MKLIKNDKNSKSHTLPSENTDMCRAASPSDCTGVIQVPPENEYEYESYLDVYDFAAPEPRESSETKEKRE